MKSIRNTLILRLLLGLELLTLVAGGGFYFLMRRALVREFDAATLSKARALAGMMEWDDGKLEFNFDDELMPEFRGGKYKNAEYFQIGLPGGKVFERSGSLKDEKIDVPGGFKTGFFEHKLRDGREGRGVVMEFKPQSEEHEHEDDDRPDNGESRRALPELVITVARGSGQLVTTLHLIAVGCALFCLALPMAVIPLVGWNVRGGLRKLDEVAAAAAGIDARTLDRRFDAANMPAELKPICLRLNELFEKLGGAFERERHFNRNVAHELRTPIAELRAVTEVALMETGGDPAASAALGECLAVARQMERLVNSLILLAQCESSGRALDLAPVNLAAAMAQAHGDAAARERIVIRPGAAIQIETHADLLQIVLNNLLSNALEYSPAGTPVAVFAELKHGRAAIAVENENHDLSADDARKIFDAFWRKDASRSGTRHAGLGLSIAAAICGALGADLNAEKIGDKITVTMLFAADLAEAKADV